MIIRMTVYDPHYIMPSMTSILINVNLPPYNCSLNFQSLDKIMNIESYKD